MGESSDVLHPKTGEAICNKINFMQDRTFFNKVLMGVYRILRSYFVSIYFYFYPLLSLIFTFLFPFVFKFIRVAARREAYQGVINQFDQNLAAAHFTNYDKKDIRDFLREEDFSPTNTTVKEIGALSKEFMQESLQKTPTKT